MLPFLIILSSVSSIIESVTSHILINRSETIINTLAKTDSAKFVNDHSYVTRHFLSPALDDTGRASIAQINNAYNPKTDGIDRDYLKDMLPYLDLSTLDPNAWWQVEFPFSLLEFLLTGGIMVMVYFSIFTIFQKVDTTGKKSKSE